MQFKKLSLVLLSIGLFSSHLGIANSQTITPTNQETPIRLNRMSGVISFNNPTEQNGTYKIIPYELGQNSKGEEIATWNVAQGDIQVTPSTLTLTPGQEQTVRITLNVPEGQDKRAIAICTLQETTDSLGVAEEGFVTKVQARNCGKLIGVRKNKAIYFGNIENGN